MGDCNDTSTVAASSRCRDVSGAAAPQLYSAILWCVITKATKASKKIETDHSQQ